MTATTPPLTDRQPTAAFPYRVLRRAGEGAMGVVYRATDTALERPVAIKLLKTDLETNRETNEEAKKRFLQEARATASLNHPNVATIYQIGEIDGAPYLAMEWLEGITLHNLVLQQGPLPFDQAARYSLELLDALDAAHRAGIVHRDIKPANLIVLDDGPLKVTDFGIATLQGRALVQTMAGQVLATPQFASPEQLTGEKVDGRSDLFSAAVVLYNALTKAWPWQADSLSGLFSALITQPPIPIHDRDAMLPADLGPFLHRALATDRDERFATAAEMRDALRTITDTGTGTGPRQATTVLRTTARLPQPLAVQVAPDARGVRQLVLGTIACWPAQSLASLDRETLLTKILDQPLHAPAFAGAARFGDRLLLVEQGVVLAVLDTETGTPQADGALPTRAEVTLYPAPKTGHPGFVALLTTALLDPPARHAALDTVTIDLGAFAGSLLGQGFRGVLRLQAEDRLTLVFLQDGRTELVLVGAGWSTDPTVVGWDTWLGRVDATASFHDLRVAPPPRWLGHSFPELELVPTPRFPAFTGKGEPRLTTQWGDDADDGALYDLPHGEVPEGALISADDLPMRRLLAWMVDGLPRLLVERGKAERWRFLADWLLQIGRARLHTELDRPGGGTDTFDLVTEDGAGKVLHIAQRIDQLDVPAFEAFVDLVVAAKAARAKRGDVGGVLLLSPHVSSAVRDAYRSRLHQGQANKLLGLDRSMGYDGFVRLSARRGFHLLLVEEREDGSFVPRFVA